MAAGEYTVHDESASNHSGNVVITGESASGSAVELAFYVGFEPSRYTFMNFGTAGTTVPASILTWVKGLPGTHNLVVTTSTGVVTTSASRTTIALETSGDHEGQYKITVPTGLQTAAGYYTLIIER